MFELLLVRDIAEIKREMKSIHNFIIGVLMIFAWPVFAAEINLYDTPKLDAKIIGQVDLSRGIVPIFKPQDGGGWEKVADPHNGAVGWIKMKDLKGKNVNYIFSQTIISDDKNQDSLKIYQHNQSSQGMNIQASQEMTKKMQDEQEALTKSMQQTLQSFIVSMNNFMQQQNHMMGKINQTLLSTMQSLASSEKYQSATSEVNNVQKK